jgi:pilus assembly protein CpaB
MRSTVLITIALGCGLVAALGVLQYMKELPRTQAVEIRNVVAASSEIDINAPFSADNLTLIEWPGSRVPPGAISDLEQLEGKYARIRLYPGEVILPGKVMDSDDASGSVRVPLGYRVVSVKSDAQTAVSNLLEPGDRVDVIVVLGQRARTTAIAKTILTAVRVFAVNREMSRNSDGSDRTDTARTVSLLVTPDQAEKLMMAGELGEIRLALRSPDDPRVDETSGVTLQDMLGRRDVADEETSAGVLANVTPRTFPTSWNDTPNDASAVASPAWTMLLLSPERSQRFHWQDKTGLPEEEPAATSGGRGARKRDVSALDDLDALNVAHAEPEFPSDPD